VSGWWWRKDNEEGLRLSFVACKERSDETDRERVTVSSLSYT